MLLDVRKGSQTAIPKSTITTTIIVLSESYPITLKNR